MRRIFSARVRRTAVVVASAGLIVAITPGAYGVTEKGVTTAPAYGGSNVAWPPGGDNWPFPHDWPFPGGPPSSDANGVLPPKANGVWIYDTIHPGLDFQDRVQLPGMWAPRVNRYNQQAASGHDITRIYSYGSSMEMYCPGRDAAKCTLDDLKIYYTPDSAGYASTRAYDEEIAKVPGAEIVVSPVVDGRIGASYFSGFNELSPELARKYTDKVTERLCADPRIDGVQFDLEPFDVTSKNGQYYFYLRIAKNFAGENETDEFHCVSPRHPDGRFFSIFAFAEVVRPGTTSAEHVAEILTRYHNGYMVQSLYDLIHSAAGVLNPAPQYAEQAQQAVQHMKTWAAKLGIPYSIGIPGAATSHEYTSCTGDPCQPAPNGETGYPMIEYTKAAISAINDHGVRDDPLFLGVDVWYLGASHYRDGYMRQPVPVPTSVWTYLTKTL